ncbi:MAG: hypothetical protein V1839_03840 [archaeon]
MSWPILGAVVAILIIVLLAVFIVKMRKGGWKRTIDYKNYFIMGVIWLPFGMMMALIFDNSVGMVFAAMGAAYLAIGLKNRDKWGKPQKVTAQKNKIIVTVVAASIMIAVLGVIAFMLFNAK